MRNVNFYISALVITVFGSLAVFLILHTAYETESFGYDEAYFEPVR